MDDVAIEETDARIARLGADARRLLWVITRSGERTMGTMIASVWGEPPSALLAGLCEAGLLVPDGAAYTFDAPVAERAAAWMERHPDERGGQTEADVWTAYGIRYGGAYRALLADAKRDLAAHAGQRGIHHLLRARAFGRLRAFASGVITGTRDRAVLGRVIADLEAALGGVPAGEARWSLRTYLADALRRTARPEQALPLYAEAAAEAEGAQHWSDLSWITGNWANALGGVGQLDRAREMHLKSADADRLAGKARVYIVGSELSALRVEVRQGRAAEALPAIEAKLGELRAWWASRQQGQPVAEAPDDEMLARALLSGLDVARQASAALKRWQPAVDLLEEIARVQSVRGTGEHEAARMRFNGYAPLMELGRIAEARTLIERCLAAFRRAGDAPSEAKAMSAQASVENALGDPAQAVVLERRALALEERLADPGSRAILHDNLAMYLHASGEIGEAGEHQLAGIVYTVMAGLDARGSLGRLARRIREAEARGEGFALVPVRELLSGGAFGALRAFVAGRAVSVEDLQVRVDALVEQARGAAPPPPQR